MSRKALKNLLGIPWLRADLRDRLRTPANLVVACANIVQKYNPYPAKHGLYVLQNSDDGHQVPTDLPVPPLGVRMGYGETEEAWLNGGKRDVDNMMRLLRSSNFEIEDGDRVLELGCAAGRMIRWLSAVAKSCEIWGVDIDARLIVWCQEHLSPPFKFATVTTYPHLPFEDRYFRCIYAGSVFTHIDDLSDAWLLELKRVMDVGARIYITVHDKHTLELIMDGGGFPEFRTMITNKDKKQQLRTGKFYKASLLPGDENCQVFYDIDYLSEHWGKMFKIVAIQQEAYWHQTAVLMEKQ